MIETIKKISKSIALMMIGAIIAFIFVYIIFFGRRGLIRRYVKPKNLAQLSIIKNINESSQKNFIIS